MPAERRARRARSEDSKKLGRNGGNEGFDEESGKSGEAAVPSPLKRAEQRPPPSPEDAGVQGSGESSPACGGVALKTKTTTSKRAKKPPPASQAEDSGDASPARGGPLPDDSADAGHDNKKSAATPKRGEKRSPPPLQEEERPEKRAAGPDAASSAPKRNKKKDRRKKKKKKQLRKTLAKPTSPPPLQEEERPEKRAAEPDAASSAPKRNKKKKGKKDRRKKKKKKQLRKALAKPPPPPPQEAEHHGREMAEQEPSNTSPPQDERRAHGDEQKEKNKNTEQEHAGDTLVLDSIASHRLNLRSDPEPMGLWGVEVKPGEPYAHEFSGCVRITQATLGNLESVDGSSIACHVNGRSPMKVCALNSTSVMYRLDLEYGEGENGVFSVVGDSSVHLAGYYKIPDAAANVQALVTQIQEADDCETTHVHGTAQEYNALDTEVHDDDTTQLGGQVGLNASANVQALVTQSQEAGHRSVDKEAINELEIEQLKSGDCNAEIASDGKKVKVEYIGRLKDGKVFDPFEGGPAIYTFTLGAGRVIAGWDQGIKGMRVGERRKLTIPPTLAYKDEPQKESRKEIPDEPQMESRKEIPDKPEKETIPANSWVVYEIELLEVLEPRKKPKKKSYSVNRH